MSRIVNEDDVDVGVIHAVLTRGELDAARIAAMALVNKLQPLMKPLREGDRFPAIMKAAKLIRDALDDAEDLYDD
jgi:hypothetical protein